MRPDVHGTVDPAFEGVREAFAANFDRGEIGAGLCVHVAGKRVVDLWAGYADRETGRLTDQAKFFRHVRQLSGSSLPPLM